MRLLDMNYRIDRLNMNDHKIFQTHREKKFINLEYSKIFSAYPP